MICDNLWLICTPVRYPYPILFYELFYSYTIFAVKDFLIGFISFFRNSYLFFRFSFYILNVSNYWVFLTRMRFFMFLRRPNENCIFFDSWWNFNPKSLIEKGFNQGMIVAIFNINFPFLSSNQTVNFQRNVNPVGVVNFKQKL